jgi:anti-sigma B factor antagonist
MSIPESDAVQRLTLTLEHGGAVAVVRLSGKLVAGETEVLTKEVRRLIPGNKRIVLDLTDLVYMDSMGLGSIIRLYVSAKSAGCDLEMINLSKRIRELLGVTNLLSVFAICGETGARSG